jgi:2-dehydro-3-deoxyphosphooctonate aldolase (KDO 8-P synthase)
MSNIITVGSIQISNFLPFSLIAVPCQIESLEHTLFMAENLCNITNKLGIGFIFINHLSIKLIAVAQHQKEALD